MSADFPIGPALLAELRRRQRVRLIAFIVCETIVVLIFLATVLAGVSSRFADESYTPVFRILPIVAAMLAAIIPVLFYGNPKRRNLGRRGAGR